MLSLPCVFVVLSKFNDCCLKLRSLVLTWHTRITWYFLRCATSKQKDLKGSCGKSPQAFSAPGTASEPYYGPVLPRPNKYHLSCYCNKRAQLAGLFCSKGSGISTCIILMLWTCRHMWAHVWIRRHLEQFETWAFLNDHRKADHATESPNLHMLWFLRQPQDITCVVSDGCVLWCNIGSTTTSLSWAMVSCELLKCTIEFNESRSIRAGVQTLR